MVKRFIEFRISVYNVVFFQHPLPACASGEWGPTKAIRHFNILPLTHFQSIFETNHSPIIIKFQCPKILKFHGKLNSNQYSPTSTSTTTPTTNNNSTAVPNILDKYVRYEYNEQELTIAFVIQLPSEGQYGLDIYARDPEYQTEKRTMSHCCKYIINYSKTASNSVLPSIETPYNQNLNNNNNFYHDYSFDIAKSNGQQKVLSPRTSSSNNKPERSLSPRKYY